MPIPSSVIEITAALLLSDTAVTTMLPPASVWRMALLRIFPKA